MPHYRNLAGDSGVVAYEIGADWIDVQFLNGAVYRYDARSVGRRDLAKMKSLAIAGRGLSSFIATEVRERYASKSA